MIKIKRRNTEKSRMAVQSLAEARKKNGTYNTPEVNSALIEIFYGKCYICENKRSTSYQIEHLVPHREQADLKYEWNNLFWSCEHCNGIKGTKYGPILDCTKEDIEEKISFRKKGYFGVDEKLEFQALDDMRSEVKNTIHLLEDVYYGTTPQKRVGAKILRKILREELSKFKEYVREYEEAENEDKLDCAFLLKRELQDSSPFAAFKRWLICDNKERYPEIWEIVCMCKDIQEV